MHYERRQREGGISLVRYLGNRFDDSASYAPQIATDIICLMSDSKSRSGCARLRRRRVEVRVVIFHVSNETYLFISVSFTDHSRESIRALVQKNISGGAWVLFQEVEFRAGSFQSYRMVHRNVIRVLVARRPKLAKVILRGHVLMPSSKHDPKPDRRLCSQPPINHPLCFKI